MWKKITIKECIEINHIFIYIFFLFGGDGVAAVAIVV